MSDTTPKELIILNDNHKKIIDEWFSMLQQRQGKFNGITYNGRKLRAELRRNSLYELICSQAGYRILADKLINNDSKLAKTEVHYYALKIFANVAAFAEKNNDKSPFAAQLSEKIKGGERNYLSELRFERLLTSETPEEFCQRLIRAVKLRGEKGVNLTSLADGIFLWMQEWDAREHGWPADTNPFKRLSVRWEMDYFSTKNNTNTNTNTKE
ncbi:type I-E CRISPR-associated protein Cse2/CasB [Gilliamella apicola]|uniref:type I-E CRISPR-associated protein Cse2/CasB n=1 Tax=Gilliamella apicola TaxID=1196095 RepID=UPI001C6466FE|nr:type I-E CRISPR-associated protein Cse2/CasB [Gilliamella apicola]WLS92176.1 type I-E CRISPR-associated protein Cse2/CasB [Gilliamella apicola]